MTWSQKLKIFLAVLFLVAVTAPSVSAFTLSSVSVDPHGYQDAGTPMTVTSVVHFPVKGNATFPLESELQLSTDLVAPSWVPVLVIDGVETRLEKKTGTSLELPGWYLAYPPGQSVQLIVKLTGTMPAAPLPDRNFLKIQEVDSGKNVVTTARVAFPEAPEIALSTLSTPTKKPTTKKVFTPIPTATAESPMGIEAAAIAAIGAALLAMKRR